MENEREKFFRQINLEGDKCVRSHISITHPVWQEYKEKLDWLEGFSSHVSVGIGRSPGRKANDELTDRWGCHWIYPLESLDGQCIGHPIDSWNDLGTYQPPDPDEFTDWEQAKQSAEHTKSQEKVVHSGTDHGFIFLRLTYLRGFEKFMFDIAEECPELEELIEIVENYWFEVVRRWIEIGADIIGFGDDLGLKYALPMSPDSWRIKPSYKRIFSYCRSNGVHVSLHTDGYVCDIIPDLIECGFPFSIRKISSTVWIISTRWQRGRYSSGSM